MATLELPSLGPHPEPWPNSPSVTVDVPLCEMHLMQATGILNRGLHVRMLATRPEPNHA